MSYLLVPAHGDGMGLPLEAYSLLAWPSGWDDIVRKYRPQLDRARDVGTSTPAPLGQEPLHAGLTSKITGNFTPGVGSYSGAVGVSSESGTGNRDLRPYLQRAEPAVWAGRIGIDERGPAASAARTAGIRPSPSQQVVLREWENAGYYRWSRQILGSGRGGSNASACWPRPKEERRR